MPDIPDRIGRYAVLNTLGQGGMGVLYLARDPVIDRHVALKLLKVDNDDLRRRFVREARSAGQLQHPNIVTVYDVGEHEGELFIAMEYIDGDTLATLIRDGAPFSTLRKLELLDQLADGLSFAHHRGIVHRDIKPANLMVTRGGLLKVLDFGIARVARPDSAASLVGAILGTPAYMAPEQLEGREVDHRADIFAVGLVMYELLSGSRAFTGPTTADVLQQVIQSEPTPLMQLVPTLDPDLARCVARAIAKRPDDRYQDLQDLRNDVSRVRRRVELQSGAFDATVVVPRPAEGGLGAGPTGQDETIVAPVFVPDARPAGAEVPPVPVPPPLPIASPGRPTERAASPTPTPARTPPPAPPAPAPPAPGPRPSAAGTAAPPPVAVAPPTLPSGMASPAGVPTAARRSVWPALLVLAAVLLLAAASAVAALWWIRAQLFTPSGPDTVAGEVVPVETAQDDPVTSARTDDGPVEAAIVSEESVAGASSSATSSASPSPASTAPASVSSATSAAPAPSVAPSRPGAVAPAAQAPAPAPSASRPASPRPAVARPDRPADAADSTPATTSGSPLATDEAPDPGRPATAGPIPSRPPEPPPSEPVVPREDALALVRAYVAARNTGHAAGLRRVWPTATDVDIRRITSEFSAPLTLSGCDVSASGPARMRAACQFTQPGTTGFSSGTTLTIRRQLTFALERRQRGWVIVDVTG